MGGFAYPFMPSPAWSRDTVFAASPWAAGVASSLADTLVSYGDAAAAVDDEEVAFLGKTAASSPTARLHEQLLLEAELLRQSDGFAAMDDGATMLAALEPCSMPLTDSAPQVICSSSSNESSGSERSAPLPAVGGFLVGDQQHAPPAAYAAGGVPSMAAGEETPQSFGFGSLFNGDLLQEANGSKYHHHQQQQQQLGAVPSSQPHHLNDDIDFNTGKLLPFASGQQQVTPSIDSLQIDQKEFSSGLHHLNLSSLMSGPLASFNATQSHRQPAEACSGKNGSAAPFVNLSEVLPNVNGSSSAGNGAPKPRVRARRGQATDPHSIAERLRREKISDRMKDLQELVPNSNKTNKASMLDEIIDYVKFLQLQVKFLSMSRLGAAEAVVPLLTETQTESSGFLLSPRSSGEKQAGAGGLPGDQSELMDGGATFEQEVVKLMEDNMTTAMQYLQSKGLCLMPVALASAISTQKGTSSAAVRPEKKNGDGGGEEDDVKGEFDAPRRPPVGRPKEMRSRV